MSRMNRSAVRITAPDARTYEGAPAARLKATQQLRRVVMANMLWEDQFYCDGQKAADIIADCVKKVEAGEVFKIAVEARENMKLRHVPLLVARHMLTADESHRVLVADLLERIIQRPDELGEFLAIYYDGQDKNAPIAAQVKKGLARAVTKFNEYQLSKWNRDSAFKLRDVIFLTHPTPKDKDQARVWAKLVNKSFVPGTLAKSLKLKKTDVKLETADTWETNLSAGEEKKTAKEKKAVFTRQVKEQKMGAMAVLMNLRNMIENKVEDSVIRNAILNMNTERVLPFRFITAARYAPQFEPELETAMFKCLEDREKLPGKTVLLVDVSGSMDDPLSQNQGRRHRSETTRMDAACGLAVLLREICEEVQVLSFSNHAAHVPLRRGFALRDAIQKSLPHGSTMTGAAIGYINNDVSYDRLIVITDEQSQDSVPSPHKGRRGYMINVAAYQNGIGSGAWHRIDGWSEAVIDYIRAYEGEFED